MASKFSTIENDDSGDEVGIICWLNNLKIKMFDKMRHSAKCSAVREIRLLEIKCFCFKSR